MLLVPACYDNWNNIPLQKPVLMGKSLVNPYHTLAYIFFSMIKRHVTDNFSLFSLLGEIRLKQIEIVGPLRSVRAGVNYINSPLKIWPNMAKVNMSPTLGNFRSNRNI